MSTSQTNAQRLSGKVAVVTGAAGFIGSHIAELIAEDERLTPVLIPLGDGILAAARD